jgi:hypothetical protein
MQAMPPRVAAMKRAIEAQGDFTGLARVGEVEVFAYARSIGMRGDSSALF